MSDYTTDNTKMCIFSKMFEKINLIFLAKRNRRLHVCVFYFLCFFFAFGRSTMDAASPPQIVVNRPNGLQEADGGEGVDLPADDHLMTLKALTEKLRLETRRPSYLEWKARLEAESFKEPNTGKCQFQEEPEGEPVTNRETAEESQSKLPSRGVLKGFENIDEALAWLRRELVRLIVSFYLISLFCIFSYIWDSNTKTSCLSS